MFPFFRPLFTLIGGEKRAQCLCWGGAAGCRAVNRLPRKVTGAVPAVGRPLLSPVAAEQFSWSEGKVKLHYSIAFLIGLHTHWLAAAAAAGGCAVTRETQCDFMTVQENERQL